MDGALLEYFIKKRGFTKDNFINRIGVAKSPFYRKMQGEVQFKLDEIQKIREVLNLSDDDVMRIFFEDKVS